MKRPVIGFGLFLGAALVVWFWPSVFGGKVLLPLDIMAANPPHTPLSDAPVHNHLIGDMIFESYQWKAFQQYAFRAGDLPLWNPFTFCGHPLYTTGQSMTFYPLNLLFLLIPLPQAFVFFTIVHLLLGGLFTYLLFRRFGAGAFGAAVGGTVFAMGGLFVARIVFPMFLATGIWLPLMILWLDVAAEPGALRRRPWLVLVGPALFAMPLLGGFLEIAFYAYLASGLFTLLRFGQMLAARQALIDGVRYLGKALLVVVFGVTLSAPQLLPFLEVMKLNVRAGEGSFESVKGSAMTGREMLTVVIPDALGNPTRHAGLDLASREWKPIKTPGGENNHYFGPKNYVEVDFYFGVLPLLFLLMGVIAPGRQRLYFWLLLVLPLAFAFVTPIYKLFLAVVPGSDQVRTPFRWLYLAVFAGTYLAAVGADRWHARLREPARPLGRGVAGAAALAALLACIAWAVMLFVPAPLIGWAESLMAGDKRIATSFANSSELAGFLWTNGIRLGIFLLLSLVILATGQWRPWTTRSGRVLTASALVLIAIDLGQATFTFNTQADPSILRQHPPVVAKLQSDKDLFRVGRYGWEKFFHPNIPTHYGLQDYGGYDSIILKNYARFLQAIELQKLLPYNIAMNFEKRTSLDSPLLPLLNIRYMLSLRPFEHANWEKIPVDGSLHLYRARKELPRAFFVRDVVPARSADHAIELLAGRTVDVFKSAVLESPNPAPALATVYAGGATGTANITEYRPSRVRIRTETDSRQVLVLSDSYYPGWNAYIDGEQVPLYAANAIFRGVSVPAGSHDVEFRFEPRPLRLGVMLSAAGAIVMLLMTGVLFMRRGSTPAPTISTSDPHVSPPTVDGTSGSGQNAPA